MPTFQLELSSSEQMFSSMFLEADVSSSLTNNDKLKMMKIQTCGIQNIYFLYSFGHLNCQRVTFTLHTIVFYTCFHSILTYFDYIERSYKLTSAIIAINFIHPKGFHLSLTLYFDPTSTFQRDTSILLL